MKITFDTKEVNNLLKSIGLHAIPQKAKDTTDKGGNIETT